MVEEVGGISEAQPNNVLKFPDRRTRRPMGVEGLTFLLRQQRDHAVDDYLTEYFPPPQLQSGESEEAQARRMIETFPQWKNARIEGARIGKGPGFRERIRVTEDLSIEDILGSMTDRRNDLANEIKAANPNMKKVLKEKRRHLEAIHKIAKRAVQMRAQKAPRKK